MADYSSPKPQIKDSEYPTLSDYEKTYYRDYSESLRNHDDNIVDYDAYEAMDMAKVFDEESKKTKNGLTDSMTATIYDERASRVVGQVPKGRMRALGMKDRGKGMLCDVLRTSWMEPNANAQRPLKEKLYRWQYRKHKYGWGIVYVDTHLSPSGYFGPDLWNVSNRNFLPQPGFTTLADMDYCHHIVYRSPQWVKNLLEQDDDRLEKQGYKRSALKECLDQLENVSRNVDDQRDDLNIRENQSQSVRTFAVVTRYEAGEDGRWVTFIPIMGCRVIRDMANPHQNKRLPFVNLAGSKDSDSWYTVGDFHTSKPMQAASDGIYNGFFRQFNRNVNPPTVVNAQTVIPQGFDPNTPGAILQMNGPVNDVKVLESNATSLNFFQGARTVVTGALQSIAGTTDTRINAEDASDSGFGKTPEAIRKISAREATRDAKDRELFEEAYKEVVDLWFSILKTIPEEIPVNLFVEEVTEIVKNGGEDLLDLLENGEDSYLQANDLAKFSEADSGDQIELKINTKELADMEYRFELDPESSAKQNKLEQLQTFMDYLGFLGKIQNVVDNYQERTGKVMSLEKINETIQNLSDIPALDELFVDANPEETPQPTENGTETGPAGQTPGTPGEVPLTPDAIKALADAPSPNQPAVPVPVPVPTPPPTAPAPAGARPTTPISEIEGRFGRM